MSGPSTHRTSTGSIRLLRIAGIDLDLHWSWFVVAMIELQTRENAYTSQWWNVLEYLTLFGIVLIHELGHAMACRSVGGRADRILLWPLGGVAFVDPPPRPGALLWSIAAGPLVNVVLLPITFGALVMLDFSRPDAPNDLLNFVFAVTTINLGLLVFNLLPIYPLDGGQILRALLWFAVGPTRSLTVASGIGFVGAVAVLALAVRERDAWLLLLAVLGAWQSINGWTIARRQAGGHPPAKPSTASGRHIKFVEYVETTDTRMIIAARRRHGVSIRDLSGLGFVEAGVLSERTPPFGILMHLITLPEQLIRREALRVEGLLRMVIYQPWMVHAQSGTYAIMFGKGVKLYTGLSDGSGVVTANFSAAPISEQARLHKTGRPMSIEQLTREHSKRIAALISGGVNVLEQSSFAGFVDLTAREDPAGIAMWLTLLIQTALGLGLAFVLVRWILDMLSS